MFLEIRSEPKTPHTETGLAFGLGLSLAAVLLAGCGTAGKGELGRLQQIEATCPDGPLAVRVSSDVSGTGRGPDFEQDRVTVIETVAWRAVTCAVSEKVVLDISAFSASTAATVTLYHGDIRLDGATKIAKLRKVPGVVDDVMATVTAKLPGAKQALPADGSDPMSQFTVADEFIRQLNQNVAPEDAYRLELTELTDGVANSGVNLNSGELTSEAAADLAENWSVPALPPGSVVTIAGVGKVAGPPPPSEYIAALKTFWTRLCARAVPEGSCTVVTDHTSIGG